MEKVGNANLTDKRSGIKSRNSKLLWVVVSIVVGCVLWAGYITLIAGTTAGPDFLEATHSGLVTPNTIFSIEVVEPTVGYMPFSQAELDNLPRRKTITSSQEISDLLGHWKHCRRGRISQNHPQTSRQFYLKVSVKRGYYWLYGKVLQDERGAVLSIEANNRNAVNPNGATTYYLNDYSEVLAILEQEK